MSDSSKKSKSKRKHTPASDSKSLDALASRESDVNENGLRHSSGYRPPNEDTASESSRTDIRGVMHIFEQRDYLNQRQDLDTLEKRSNLIPKKSPAKSAASRLSTMVQQDQDIHSLTLDKLGLASHMVPLPVYQFLENIPMDYHVRLDLKTEMLTLLRIDQFGYPFITDINVSKTNGSGWSVWRFHRHFLICFCVCLNPTQCLIQILSICIDQSIAHQQTLQIGSKPK